MPIDIEYTVTERGKDANIYRLIGGPNPGEKQTFDQIEEFMKNSLITIAKDALTEEIGRGFPRNYRQIIDGTPGKRLSNIKPFGKAIFVAPQNVRDIILFIWDSVYRRSPVDTGIYRSLHKVLLNGKQIAKSRQELVNFFDNSGRELQLTDRFRFVNEAPYARKLERYGVTASKRRSTFVKSKDKKGRSGPTVRKPSGVYALTGRAAKRKFGRNARIKFEFVPGPEVGRTDPLGGRQPISRSAWRATYARGSSFNSGFYLYPTIVVSPIAEGFLQ